MKRKLDFKHLNKDDIEKKLSFRKKKKVNGKNIDKNDKDEYLIKSAMKKLSDKNLVHYPTVDSVTADAMTLLGAFGITINTEFDADLDLKQTVSDSETIENPNIEDKNLKNLKNKKKDAKDKFPDPDDPFYKLGKKQRQFKQRSSDTQAIELPELAIQKVAAAISEINLDSSSETKFDEFK